MEQKEEFQLILETIEPSIAALNGAIKGVYTLSTCYKGLKQEDHFI